jgi:hypothetical protein
MVFVTGDRTRNKGGGTVTPASGSGQRMKSKRTLGTCPHCETSIPHRCLLIEYERDGDRAAYAACPDCDAVVQPTDD